MKSKKILIVGSHDSVKGGITTVINQYKQWNCNEYELLFLTSYKYKNKILNILYFLRSYIILFFLLFFKKYGCIHFHMSSYGSFFRKYYLSRLAKCFNTKYIIHLHGSEFMKFYSHSTNKVQKKIKNLFHEAETVITLGANWKNKITEIASKSNIEIINNCVEKRNFRNYPNKFTLTFTGVLIERKGVMDLLKALRKFSNDDLNNMTVNIVGEGAQREILKQYAQSEDINCVVWHGWKNKSEIMEILDQSTIFVLPSYNEGLPMSILEAMSVGLPVVSTDVGSINDAVEHNVNGFLIKPGDVESLYKHIKCLYNDSFLLNEMSVKCFEIFSEKFNIDIFYKKNLDLYKKVVE